MPLEQQSTHQPSHSGFGLPLHITATTASAILSNSGMPQPLIIVAADDWLPYS